ncbi:MAG: hypothetical protein KAT74_03025, partial [Candidatus Cloacimonetes bacterium]|nr:hypothetical protein [Candidatus Cloacimonadota bacterium]
MRKNVILVLVILSVSAGLFGQYSYNLSMFEPVIIDARAEALGRTSILSSTGANFIFNNPAMLSNLAQNNIQFTGRVRFGKDELKEKYDNETDKIEFKYLIHMKLNGLSFGMPFFMSDNKDLKLGFGIGYRTYFDWGYNMHYEDEDSDYEYDIKYHGGLSTLVLGSGLNYQNKFFGGVSISFPFLSNISSEYENNDGAKNETEGTMKGTFFTLSGSYIVNEKITIGARIRTGFTLKWEEEDDDGDKFKYDIIIPSEFGLAIEMKPNTSLKLYAEYLTRGFGNYKIETDYGDFDFYGDSNNGYSIRTGFEVGTSNVFRGGFFMQSVPIYELRYFDDSYPVYDKKPQTEIGFTAGFGVKINPNLSLDIFGAYSFLNYDESYDDDWREQISNDYSFSRIKIGCSMG